MKDVKKEGNLVAQFANAKLYRNCSIVKQQGFWYIYNSEKKLMSEIPWEEADVCDKYVITKTQDNRYFLFSIEGECIHSIVENVDLVQYIGSDYFVVTQNEKKALLKGAKNVGAFDNQEDIEVNLDLSIVFIKYQGKYMVKDFEGNLLINQLCDDVKIWINYFADIKLLMFLQDGKWGIYRLGQGIIVPCKMDHVEINSEYIECLFNDKKGIYDMQGNMLINLRFFQIRRIGNVFKVAIKSGRRVLYGVYDLKGNMILPCEFSRVIIYHEKGIIEGEKVIRRVIKRIPN